MKKYIFLAGMILLAIACEKTEMPIDEELTIEEELIGQWSYERVSIPPDILNNDTQGTMVFNSDETGTWTPALDLPFTIEWDLQRNDTKIAISKYYPDNPNFNNSDLIYDLERVDENMYQLSYFYKYLNELILGADTTTVDVKIVLTKM